MTVGGIVLISIYTRQLSRPLRRIMQQIEDLQRASASIERVEALRNIVSHVQDGSGVRLPEGALEVEFRDVTFEYHAGKVVLDRVSFYLQSDKVLGLLGRTGSGKTTITRLIFRLYDPQEGIVLIGDYDIKEATLAQLRERIGMVTQEVQLFQGTIRDNLTFF
jgi:ATP-binding cassette, subfamily B, bacterial